MTTKRLLIVSVWLVTLGLVFWLDTSVGQQSAPTENKGVEVQGVNTIDLGPDILRSAQLIRNATLKVYPGAPHGMCTVLADKVNADLLAFAKA